MANPPHKAPSQRWPWPQRWIHWGLVFALALAWWSANRSDELHAWCGYAVATLVGVRIILGFSRHTRGHWLEMAKALTEWPVSLRKKTRLLPLGHPSHRITPNAALSIIVLLTLSLAMAISGWMMTLEQYVGEDWLEDTHRYLFNFLLAWVGLHVSVVLFLSAKEGNNRIKSMITGRGLNGSK